MNNYERASLKKMQVLYDFLVENPGSTVAQIKVHLGLPFATVANHMTWLRDGDHLVVVRGKHVYKGQEPSRYSVSEKGRPTEPPQNKRTSAKAIARDDEKVDLPIDRQMVRAAQIGMHRDPLVAALFGQVAA